MNGDCPREKLEALWDLLARHRGDRPVAIEVEINGGARARQSCAPTSPPSIRVRTSEQFVAAVEQLCGAGSVTVH